LVRSKGDLRISVCIPARNEASTVGQIVESIVYDLTAEGGICSLVDEVLVIDDGSVDDTASVANSAGAIVVSARSRSGGKGSAMSIGVSESSGDIVVFLDADVLEFSTHFVTGLVGPLLTDESVVLVKGCYDRALNGHAGEGGRVTELVAKPLIDLLFPELSAVRQPLAGETAALRTVLEKVLLAPDYGVELALLLDVWQGWGAHAIAQVDLESRTHRNRPLSELRPQATEVLRAALARSGMDIATLGSLRRDVGRDVEGTSLAECPDDGQRAQ
jgi:glucosyl-3-phosphoglycerate synthase